MLKEKVKKELLAILAKEGKLSMKQFEEITGITSFGISPLLKELEAENKITIKSDRNRKMYENAS